MDLLGFIIFGLIILSIVVVVVAYNLKARNKEQFIEKTSEGNTTKITSKGIDHEENIQNLEIPGIFFSLQVIAFLEAISGLIMAILIWITYGKASSLAIGIGIGILIQGVIMAIIMVALANIGKEVTDIRGKLDKILCNNQLQDKKTV